MFLKLTVFEFFSVEQLALMNKYSPYARTVAKGDTLQDQGPSLLRPPLAWANNKKKQEGEEEW